MSPRDPYPLGIRITDGGQVINLVDETAANVNLERLGPVPEQNKLSWIDSNDCRFVVYADDEACGENDALCVFEVSEPGNGVGVDVQPEDARRLIAFLQSALKAVEA